MLRMDSVWMGFAVLLLLALPAWADEEPAGREGGLAEVLAAFEGDSTPALATAMATKGAEAEALRKQLAGKPEAVGAVAAALLAKHASLATRDEDAAIAVADWVLSLVNAAIKEAPKNAHVLGAVWQANLARGRIGILRDKGVQAGHWCTAADALAGLQVKAPASEQRTADMIQAVALLQEAASGTDAPLTSLAGHAQRVCRRLLKAAPKDMELRRALAASYLWQGDVFHETSRRAWQSSLHGYFEAFQPIAHESNADRDDIRAWNKSVSVARAAKLDLKADYIATKVLVASKALSCELPKTGAWSYRGGEIHQSFADEGVFRFVTFEIYRWDSVYGAKGSARDVGGDNVKGIAGRSFDTKIEDFTKGPKKRKIKRKRKPKRTRFNKTLPAGIEYTIEYVAPSGKMYRLRRFFVKSVKAERTVQITILESASLEGDDPEWRDVIDSFDVTKKKR